MGICLDTGEFVVPYWAPLGESWIGAQFQDFSDFKTFEVWAGKFAQTFGRMGVCVESYGARVVWS